MLTYWKVQPLDVSLALVSVIFHAVPAVLFNFTAQVLFRHI